MPVPELATTLTVHLINLESSKDTNIVYTSFDDILPNATQPTLPSSVCWDSPEVRSKAGDVVLWASRIRRKACHVHTCWVFDGNAWIKAVSDTEVKLSHPTNSRYQLVILSGPYVKWEIKKELKSKSRRASKKSSSRQQSKVTTHSGDSAPGWINADGASSAQAIPSLCVLLLFHEQSF
ncbi:MAG TPA: hypothetical protein VGO47_13280 [Chlamydiales bacterium]|nr:hypothetical protein [Chlamydiales bacterium]